MGSRDCSITASCAGQVSYFTDPFHCFLLFLGLPGWMHICLSIPNPYCRKGQEMQRTWRCNLLYVQFCPLLQCTLPLAGTR